MTVNELIKDLEFWRDEIGGDKNVDIFLDHKEYFPTTRVCVDTADNIWIECKTIETYGEFEFSTDDFFKSVLPRRHEPISERDSYNADF